MNKFKKKEILVYLYLYILRYTLFLYIVIYFFIYIIFHLIKGSDDDVIAPETSRAFPLAPSPPRHEYLPRSPLAPGVRTLLVYQLLCSLN